MFPLRIFVIFSIYLGTNGQQGTPCQYSNVQDINICEVGFRQEDPNTQTVLIRADSMKNCTCELSVINQVSEEDITIGPYENYASSHPGTVGGCGLIIHFFVSNMDKFYDYQCSMLSMKRHLTVNQKVLVTSQIATGYLQNGTGYCIEIKNERTRENHGKLYLKCGLQTELQMTTTITSFSTLSTQIWTDANNLDDSAPTSLSSMSLISTMSTNNLADPPPSVAVVVGASVGSVIVLLLIVITIFAVFKTRRSRSSKRNNSNERNINEVNARGDDCDYGLQYNSLYNTGFQPEPNTHNTVECKENPTLKTKITITSKSVDVNDIIDSAMEKHAYCKPIDKAGAYSTIVDYVNPSEAKKDDTDMVRQPRFPEVDDKTSHLHNDRTDCTEDKSNKDVYAVPDKQKVKHVITPSGCEYALVNK